MTFFVVAARVLSVVGCSNERRTEPVARDGKQRFGDGVQQANVPDWLEAVGTVQAAQTSQISAR